MSSLSKHLKLERKKLFWAGITVSLCLLLLYSRTVNLGWGLPYPMHPDERNMVDSITRMQCRDWSELTSAFVGAVRETLGIGQPMVARAKPACMNPDFFAYGQFTLYLGYALAHVITFLETPQAVRAIPVLLQFSTVALSLRIISAVSSCISVWAMIQIIRTVYGTLTRKQYLIAFLASIFSPVAIQFAHFGTTESIITCFYLLIILVGLRAMERPRLSILLLTAMAALVGLAVGSKVSAATYIALPLFVVCFFVLARLVQLYRLLREIQTLTAPDELPPRISQIGTSVVARFLAWDIWHFAAIASIATLVGLVFAAISSPYNVILPQDLKGSLNYETSVGIGSYVAFYTRQFLLEKPFWFQIRHVFPYALGGPMWLLSILGILLLPWRSKHISLLRFALVVIFVSNGFLYAKWTRFLAPMYPIMVIMGVVFLLRFGAWAESRLHKAIIRKYALGLWAFIVCLICIPGIAYMNIYRYDDVRYVASRWIYSKIPSSSPVLSETANVIDIPIVDTASGTVRPDGYALSPVSFNHYELADRTKQYELEGHLQKAAYIFVPSRRVFYNHTCRTELPAQVAYAHTASNTTLTKIRHSPEKCDYLARTYPQLDEYYDRLFAGGEYRKVAEFTSYPRISVFGLFQIEFPDEEAEETYTVFDHPVIRIYERIPQPIKP